MDARAILMKHGVLEAESPEIRTEAELLVSKVEASIRERRESVEVSRDGGSCAVRLILEGTLPSDAVLNVAARLLHAAGWHQVVWRNREFSVTRYLRYFVAVTEDGGEFEFAGVGLYREIWNSADPTLYIEKLIKRATPEGWIFIPWHRIKEIRVVDDTWSRPKRTPELTSGAGAR